VTAGKTVVAVEEPGYPPLRSAFEACGARLAPVPVDAEGIVVERIPNGLVCGLGAIPTDRVEAGVRRLAALLR